MNVKQRCASVVLIAIISSLCNFIYGAETINHVDSLTLGNCQKSIVRYEPVRNYSGISGAALFYPSSTMSMYKGCNIKSIYVGVNNKVDSDSAKIFISSTIDGTPLYEQEVAFYRNGWNRIELDKPYTVTGDAIYIGYTTKGARMLCCTETKEVNEEWIFNYEESWSKFTKDYCLALYAIVDGNNLPMHNARLKNVRMSRYSLTNSDLLLEGDVSNLGAEDINNIEFTAYIDDKTVAKTIDNLNIASGGIAHISIPGVKITDEGTFDLKIAATKINGAADADVTDNVSRTSSILCRNEFVARKTLMEVFTSEKCNSCPDAHTYLAGAIKDDDNIIEMTHHAGLYDDGFTIPESKELEWFYMPELLFAPGVMLDRVVDQDNYPQIFSAPTPIESVSKKTFPTMRSITKGMPAFATVNLDVTKTASPRNFDIKVSGKQLLPIKADGDTRLCLWVTEDSLYSIFQEGHKAGYYHRFVARKSITDTWGEPIDMADGYSQSFNFTIPEEWNMDNIALIAYVANYNVDDRTDCTVYNAEEVKLKEVIEAGADLTNSDDTVYSRNGDYINLLNDDAVLTVFDLSGARVFSASYNAGEAFDTKAIANGCYIVNITTKDKAAVLKILK